MADISKITLPNGDSYDIKDNGAVRINDGTLTGTTTAESLLSDEVVAGSLIVNGDARFVNTINGDISGNAATATKAVQDGNGSVITSTYVKKAGDTLTGALNFANNTLNLMGDDAYIGDQNIGGCIVIKGKNGATGIQFAPYSGSTSQKISIDGAGTMTITGTVAGTFSGSLSGNATSATKATQDGSGNTITSTYVKKAGDTMTGTLNLTPASGEGGELHLNASTANTSQAGIALDVLNSQFRIFGIASADGTTKTGTGTPLVIDPYAKTITGGYTITGSLSGNASTATKATQDGSGNTITSYYCTLSTAQTISGVKTFSTMPIANGISVVSTNPGTSGGLSLYTDKTPTNYGIAMRNTSSTTKHGYVQGDWATYLYMAGAENRGWIFYGNGGLRASISNAGNAVFNGSVTVGGNTGNTSGCEMVFDSTTESVLMSFH